MVNIEILRDYTYTDTIVPNEFIDFFMPEANGEFVKVYLYLLRCIHSHASNCTISEIADKFNISSKTVRNHISNVIQKLGVKGRSQAILELIKMNEIKL